MPTPAKSPTHPEPNETLKTNAVLEKTVPDAELFFDEADALFGKRSEVRDAHDRYSNTDAPPPPLPKS